MAILFVEGFTGVPRVANGGWANTHPLYALGWTLNAKHSGTRNVSASDGNVVASVEADPAFASRSQVSLQKTSSSSLSLVQQMTQAFDTSGYQKYVIGGMFMVSTTDTSAAGGYAVISGAVQFPSSTDSFPTSDIFAQFYVPNNGADGTASATIVSQSLVTPLLKKDKWTHFEVFIEQDTDRVRVYLDGTLVLDYTYTGTFGSATGGMSLTALRSTAQYGVFATKFSNIYLLGCDDVHTGPLGPGARVLELPPQADFATTWDRPAAYASNAAVLQQYFNATAPSFLTTADTTPDLYKGPDAVAANAATVYGVAMKVNAMTMAEGNHAIAAAAQYGASSSVGPRSYNLQLGTLKPLVLDISKNPATAARWTPSEITAAGIGIKMLN